jgi:multidrug/hemolysin transport system permease protein
MKNALLLARRNILIYWRDKTGVFLSFIAAVILLFLYIFFLHKLNTDGIEKALIPLGVTHEQAIYFVDAWVFAGIVTVTTVTTGLAALVGFVDDRITGRFTEFVVMPLRRWQIVAGYFIASVTVAFTMTSIILFLGWGVLRILTGDGPGLGGVLEAWGWVLLCSAAFAAFSSFLITFIKSVGAFTTLSTIVGTMIGFVTGSYIPSNVLPGPVANGLNALPFAQAASLLRRALAGDALDQIAGPDALKYHELAVNYGFILPLGDGTIPPWAPVVTLVVMIFAFGGLAVLLLQRRIRRGR